MRKIFIYYKNWFPTIGAFVIHEQRPCARTHAHKITEGCGNELIENFRLINSVAERARVCVCRRYRCTRLAATLLHRNETRRSG